MVIRDDITVGRNDDTTTCCSTLGSLHLTLAGTALLTLSTTKEAAKGVGEEIFEGVAVLDGLNLGIDDRLDVDY